MLTPLIQGTEWGEEKGGWGEESDQIGGTGEGMEKEAQLSHICPSFRGSLHYSAACRLLIFLLPAAMEECQCITAVN